MTREEHLKAVENFLKDYKLPSEHQNTRFLQDLHNLIYLMNERGIWSNEVELDANQVIMAWSVVQALLNHSLPENLKI